MKIRSAFILYNCRSRTWLHNSIHRNVCRNVHLRGNTAVSTGAARLRTLDETALPPPDPSQLTKDECEDAAGRLIDWLRGKKSVLCITGAGLSTESGIPDYRGHKGSYFRGHKPMIHDQFVSSERHRKRYWRRSLVGWRDFALSQPNSGHTALASLEKKGVIGVRFDEEDQFYLDTSHKHIVGSGNMSIITQNVDGLHLKGGAEFVTELHGRNDRLVCLNCGHHHCRHHFHDLLDDLNPEYLQPDALVSRGMLPDGDGDVEDQNLDMFIVPPCPRCSIGILKPDVVFFGDNVPISRVDRCYAAVKKADGLLCVGTSLAVHSAYRFVQAAHSDSIPIAVLNVGETRAESSKLPLTKIEAPTGRILSIVDEFFSN